jgi:hypothetical protein
LHRNAIFPAGYYFALFAAVELAPAGYVAVVASVSWPPAQHRVLHDQGVADLLGMNATDVYLNGFSSSGVSGKTKKT